MLVLQVTHTYAIENDPSHNIQNKNNKITRHVNNDATVSYTFTNFEINPITDDVNNYFKNCRFNFVSRDDQTGWQPKSYLTNYAGQSVFGSYPITINKIPIRQLHATWDIDTISDISNPPTHIKSLLASTIFKNFFFLTFFF